MHKADGENDTGAKDGKFTFTFWANASMRGCCCQAFPAATIHVTTT